MCGKWTAYIYKRVLSTITICTNTALPCCSHIRGYWCSKLLTGAGPDQSTCKWEIQLHKANKLPHPFNKKASFCKHRDGTHLFPPLLAGWAVYNHLTDMQGFPGRSGEAVLSPLLCCASLYWSKSSPTPAVTHGLLFAQPLILGWYPWFGLAKIKARCATASAEEPGLYSWGHNKSHPLSFGRERDLNMPSPARFTFALCQALVLHKSALKRA